MELDAPTPIESFSKGDMMLTFKVSSNKDNLTVGVRQHDPSHGLLN